MAVLRSPGIGSGLDVNGLVAQLVAAERAPQEQRIERQDARFGAQISALATLKGALSALQTSLAPLGTQDAFQAHKATSSDIERFTATASAAAAPGSYGIEVVQLASAHRLVSAPFAGGASSVVGTGTLTLSAGAESFEVLIDDTNNTLAGIRDAINGAADNTGVRATLIASNAGSRLILTSNETGAAQAVRVTQTGGDGGLAQLVYDPPNPSGLTELEAAQDALVRIDGFDYTSASNTIEGAIDGATLTLLEAAPGTTLSLDIEADTTLVGERVKKFVTDFNALASAIAMLRRFNPATREAGPLLGDAMLRGIESTLRSTVASSVATEPYDSLASLGVTTKADGTLQLDQAKLSTALAADFGAVSRVFASAEGVAAKLDARLEEWLAADASLATRSTRLQDARNGLVQERERLDRRMDAIEARYRAQFSALDTLLSSLQSTSAYLAQQLASLPKP